MSEQERVQRAIKQSSRRAGAPQELARARIRLLDRRRARPRSDGGGGSEERSGAEGARGSRADAHDRRALGLQQTGLELMIRLLLILLLILLLLLLVLRRQEHRTLPLALLGRVGALVCVRSSPCCHPRGACHRDRAHRGQDGLFLAGLTLAKLEQRVPGTAKCTNKCA